MALTDGIASFVQSLSEAQKRASVNVIKGGLESGTWADELVAIRYAAWIEPTFEVQDGRLRRRLVIAC